MTEASLLEQVLLHIHNRFSRETSRLEVTATGGTPSEMASVPDGAWYWVEGSVFNDGLHKKGEADWTDEECTCSITVCAVPKALLTLVSEEMLPWCEASAAAALKAASGPYASESFDGYSYSLRSDLAGDGSGGLTGWQAAFASRLNPYRKIG